MKPHLTLHTSSSHRLFIIHSPQNSTCQVWLLLPFHLIKRIAWGRKRSLIT
jgi:hypothetical protein